MTTAWTTGSIPAVAGKQAWMYALPLDIDGRHGMDLLVGSKGKNASVGWLEAPANPRDLSGWTYHRLQDAGWIMSLERHDIDIDGDWDIVVSDRRGPKRGVYWLENPGRVANRKGRGWKRHEIGARGVEVLFLALGALVMRGRVTELKDGAGFVQQLITVYSDTLGAWSVPIIALAALTTMFSTTLVVLDAFDVAEGRK